MTEADRPKSSWQSWVRSAERGRRGSDPDPPVAEAAAAEDLAAWTTPTPAATEAAPVAADAPPAEPAFVEAPGAMDEPADPDRAAIDEPASARESGVGDPAVADEATSSAAPGGWGAQTAGDTGRRVGEDDDLDVVLRWGADDEEPEAVAWDEAAHEVGDEASLEADDDTGSVLDVEIDEGDDTDEDGEFGELLPSVPLLPSIAGRVEALGGVLRSISHRVDGLNAATDVYRSTVVDRIDEFTETVLEQGRRSEASLDEYRRTTERTIAELRRRITEQGELASRLLARIEEVGTDVASLAAGGATGLPPDFLAAQQATDRTLGHIRELLEIVVDTMPASAEGSGADLGAAIGDVKAAVDRLAAKRPPAAAPAPTPGLDAAAVGDLADAVVARLDLDALALLVAEHLAAGFEVVPDAPAAPTEPEAPAKGRRRR